MASIFQQLIIMHITLLKNVTNVNDFEVYLGGTNFSSLPFLEVELFDV